MGKKEKNNTTKSKASQAEPQKKTYEFFGHHTNVNDFGQEIYTKFY